ncbi:enoyl-CoA hydratase/isomerase family protein [Gilvimarinus sp. F26214L]|uniref:enoyl-CoA hydratase/isomerase family protein n=1 Tax=Gilvimarinus sp. DZF01 TaxID=3461371 RepID=UPI00404643B9
MESVVVFSEHATRDGGRIMSARLNAPRSLNALSLDMIRLLQPKLDAWARDPSVVAVWLEGTGDKAFCAGGDILALYRAMVEGQPADGDAFFTEEYRLDYSIHTYPKPIIVWGNGIVMGGGLGLMAGAGFRVVTENSHIAMPEIGIGLFPDVGGSWFLNHMPGRCGLFLGLTGAALNGADAIFLGLADRLIQQDRKDATFAALLDANWNSPAATINHVLREQAALSADAAPQSVVREQFDQIQNLTDADDPEQLIGNIANYSGDNPWLGKAARNLAHGSPASAALFMRQLNEARHAGLADVFRMELVMARTALRQGEFAEGVRALLVDKDKKPRWRYPDIAQVDPAWVARFFTPPWPPAEHPLRDLEKPE